MRTDWSKMTVGKARDNVIGQDFSHHPVLQHLTLHVT